MTTVEEREEAHRGGKGVTLALREFTERLAVIMRCANKMNAEHYHENPTPDHRTWPGTLSVVPPECHALGYEFRVDPEALPHNQGVTVQKAGKAADDLLAGVDAAVDRYFVAADPTRGGLRQRTENIVKMMFASQFVVHELSRRVTHADAVASRKSGGGPPVGTRRPEILEGLEGIKPFVGTLLLVARSAKMNEKTRVSFAEVVGRRFTAEPKNEPFRFMNVRTQDNPGERQQRWSYFTEPRVVAGYGLVPKEKAIKLVGLSADVGIPDADGGPAYPLAAEALRPGRDGWVGSNVGVLLALAVVNGLSDAAVSGPEPGPFPWLLFSLLAIGALIAITQRVRIGTAAVRVRRRIRSQLRRK
jgi:hypothetical protein